MKEPAVLIGLIASIAVAVLTQIAGSGLVNGNGLVLVNDIAALIPIVVGIITRQLVTPVASPTLPIGTPVTTPTGQPAIVNGAAPSSVAS